MRDDLWEENREEGRREHACERDVCRSFDVSVPVTITPFATPRRARVSCSRRAEVTPGHRTCEDRTTRIEFTISQRLDVDVPVRFGADVRYSDTCVHDRGECGRSGSDRPESDRPGPRTDE